MGGALRSGALGRPAASPHPLSSIQAGFRRGFAALFTEVMAPEREAISGGTSNAAAANISTNLRARSHAASARAHRGSSHQRNVTEAAAATAASTSKSWVSTRAGHLEQHGQHGSPRAPSRRPVPAAPACVDICSSARRSAGDAASSAARRCEREQRQRAAVSGSAEDRKRGNCERAPVTAARPQARCLPAMRESRSCASARRRSCSSLARSARRRSLDGFCGCSLGWNLAQQRDRRIDVTWRSSAPPTPQACRSPSLRPRSPASPAESVRSRAAFGTEPYARSSSSGGVFGRLGATSRSRA
jgi:hypothetical protein